MPKKTFLALLALLALLAALPAGAPAATKYKVQVGMGDQAPEMFGDPNFTALKLKKARFFIRWNAIDNPETIAKADRWVAEARRTGVRPMMHVDAVFAPRTELPTVKEYREKVGALVKRYRVVKEWGAWNEVNSKTQPTFKSPKRVAQFYLQLRKMCRGCTIVALDLLDSGNVKKYIRDFYRALGKKNGAKANIVGIHNYGDTNRNRTTGTKLIIRETLKRNKKAKFWLTETGGLAYLRSDTRTTFPCNEKRQAKAINNMFKLAIRYRKHVKRLISYNFYGIDCDPVQRFDAGLIRRDGSKRPAYFAFRKQIKRFIR
jgi:hypothetical protein